MKKSPVIDSSVLRSDRPVPASRRRIGSLFAIPALLLAAAAHGQTTYTYLGTADNTDASRWDGGAGGAVNWSDGATPAGPPGSLLNPGGALDDIVILRHNLAANTGQEIRLQQNAGIIASLEIGGSTDAAGADGAKNAVLALRGAGQRLTVSGDVTLGAVLNGQRGGQINWQNNNSILTVEGNVVSGSVSGANNININQGASSKFNLQGDIDSAAARSDLLDDFEIDLIVSRNEALVFTGAGAQTLNLESFNVVATGANALLDVTQTIPADKTITALNGVIGQVVNNSRTYIANLVVDGGKVDYDGFLYVGSGRANTANNTADATGTLTVGGASGGTVSVDGELRLGDNQETNAGNMQVVRGHIVVNNAASVLDINADLAMGSSVQPGGTTVASMTINDGTVNLGGSIFDDAAQAGNSTITITGGELALTSGVGGARDFDILNFTGGTIDWQIATGLASLAVDNATLSAAADGSVIDLTSGGAPDSTSNNAILDTWNGGSGDWTVPGNWDVGAIPAQADGASGAGQTFTLLTSVVGIVNQGNAALSAAAAADAAGWTLDQSDPNKIDVTNANAIPGSGPVKAVIDTAVTVDRTTSLKIQNASGQGADATELDLGGAAILNVTGDLTIGGSAAQASVTQSGTSDLNVSGDLLFGGVGGTQGGVYNLNGGTLDVGGDVVEDSAAVDNAQLLIDGGTLTVSGGDITVQRFAVAQAGGTTGNHVLGAGQTLTTTGTLAVGSSGNGTLTATDAVISIGSNVEIGEFGSGVGVITLGGATTLDVPTSTFEVAGNGTGELTLNDSASVTNGGADFRVANIGTGVLNMNGSSSLTHAGGNFEVAETASADGTLNMNTSGTLTLNSNNFILGQTAGSVAALNLTAGTIDLTPSANSGHLNVNGGDATITMQGGLIHIGDDLNLGSTPVSKTRWNQSGGTVLVDDTVSFRNNGDDRIDLSGTAVLRTGQLAGQNGNFIINATSTVGAGGNHLTLRGSNVTCEVTGAVGNFLANANTTLNWEFDDSGLSTISVAGNVTLSGALANFTHVGTVPPSSGTFTVIDNQGANPVNGTFAGLGEGATFSIGAQIYQVTYLGGDGNDVVVAPLADPVISIASDGDITEGALASWTVTALPAPAGSDVIVNISYSGTAADGSDFTGVASVVILDGQGAADLDLSTVIDGVVEGCETITAKIDSVSGANASVGAPDSAVLSMRDGNNPPEGSNLSQLVVGTGTVALNDIVVSDPDTGFSSTVSGSAGSLIFTYTGANNTSVFEDGSASLDHNFDLDADTTFGEVRPVGYAVHVTVTPTAGDVMAGNSRNVFEIGGSSNGSGIYLIDGVPYFIAKMNSTGGNAPGSLNDTDWGDNGNDGAVCVPLAAAALTAGQVAEIAVVFTLDNIEFSTNGAAAASQALANVGTRNNWSGNETVNLGSAGDGGTSSTAGTFLTANFVALDNGAAGGAVGCAQFYNGAAATYSLSAASGPAESVTATLTIQGWSAATDGSISNLTDQGGGAFSLTGDLATVNAALAAAEFVAGATTSYPVVIEVAVDDGDEDGGGAVTGSITILDSAQVTVYVDDDFSGAVGDPIADADGGSPAPAATFGVDAFDNLATALAAVDAGGTIVVNDGDYSGETNSLSGTMALRVAGTGGVDSGSTAQVGTLNATSGNSIDLQGNTLDLRAGTIDATVANSTGSGNLTKSGGGLAILRNTTSHTGTTTVSEGILRIGTDSATILGSLAGNGPVVVEAAGALEFNPALDTQTITQTGAISGDGAVRAIGNGAVVFDGPSANTFSGGFQMGDGGVTSFDGVDQGAKEGITVVNRGDHLGSGLITARGSQLRAATAGLTIPNDIDVGGGALRMGGTIPYELGGTITIVDGDRGFSNYGLEGMVVTVSGTVNLNDGTGRRINIEGSNARDNGAIVFAGPIVGEGGIVDVTSGFDDGLVTMLGANSYTGVTDVDGGTLLLAAGSTHAGGGVYTVRTGATLAGNGSTDAAVTVNAGGTLSPGASIGALATGDLTLLGTLVVEVDNTTGTAGTDWDQVQVTGAVDVTGGTVEVIDLGTTIEPIPAEISIIANDDTDPGTGPLGAESGPSDYLGSGSFAAVGLAGGSDANDVVVNAGALSPLGAWRLANFGFSSNTGNAENTSDAGDLDTLINVLEFAFGTNPNASDNLPLVVADGTNFTPGLPVTHVENAGGAVNFTVRYVARTDGAVTYTVQFSYNLAEWETIALAPPAPVSDDGSGYQVVEVPYPLFLSTGRKARFFRVVATLN